MPAKKNKNDYKFKGVWIPKAIWENDKLTWLEKCLLAEISALDDGTGCWASNTWLSKKFHTSASTMANYVSKLRKSGWLVLREQNVEGRLRSISLSDECRVHPEVKGQDGTDNSEVTGESPTDDSSTPIRENTVENTDISDTEKEDGKEKFSLKPYLSIWKEAFGGYFNQAQSSSHIKGVDTEFGTERAVEGFTKFVKERKGMSNPDFLPLYKFWQEPTRWISRPSLPAGPRPKGVDKDGFTAAQRGSEKKIW